MVKLAWTLQRTRFHCYRNQWRWAIHHSNQRLGIVHGDLRLVCGCLAMETNFMKLLIQTVLLLKLLPEAVWNSVVSAAIEDRQSLRAMSFSTRRSRSLSLCGLPLHSWAVVAPRCFHFTITALAVDQGSSSMAEIWTDLLKRWHSMTVPRWKSLSSSTATACLWRLHGCGLDFIHLSATVVAESWIHSFEEVSTYFCIYSVDVCVCFCSVEEMCVFFHHIERDRERASEREREIESKWARDRALLASAVESVRGRE